MPNDLVRACRSAMILIAATLLTGCVGVHVSSVPEGATVMIGQRATKYRTPAKVPIRNFRLGKNRVDVRLDGYTSVTKPQNVDVRFGGANLAIELLFCWPVAIVDGCTTQWKVPVTSSVPPLYLQKVGGPPLTIPKLSIPATLKLYRPHSLVGAAVPLSFEVVEGITGEILRKAIFKRRNGCTVTTKAATVSLTTSPWVVKGSKPIELEDGKTYYVQLSPGRTIIVDEATGKAAFARCKIVEP
jgi:hypothetical protein